MRVKLTVALIVLASSCAAAPAANKAVDQPPIAQAIDQLTQQQRDWFGKAVTEILGGDRPATDRLDGGASGRH